MKKVFIALVFSAAMPLTAVAGGADTFQPSWVSASGGGGHDHDVSSMSFVNTRSISEQWEDMINCPNCPYLVAEDSAPLKGVCPDVMLYTLLCGVTEAS